MTLFTSTGAVIVSDALSGYITNINIIYDNPQVPLLGYTETFTIASSPEPGTSWLAGLGLVGVVAKGKRCF